jgi:hypothetical protein
LDFSATTNRITTSNYHYDKAGNVDQEPNGKTYTYDAENHQKSFHLVELRPPMFMMGMASG